ncbi:hypothetical protein CK203_030811 [Vitis vinifera]|uniref:Uncharacterized protein n=1 Tax=Vitis vinifera TaxID=29760 RepID=A0A438ID07_VITVI|nr:hypothetical protein CK203_030811 [Vitis vinifera]
MPTRMRKETEKLERDRRGIAFFGRELNLVWRRPKVMEQKHILLSALSVGVGVSVGLGLASGQTVSRWTGLNCSPDAITEEQIEHELLRQVVDGRESKITFDEFPYFLR